MVFGLFQRKDDSDSSSSSKVPPIPADHQQDGILTMPAEEYPHEATWLQWPHNHGGNGKRRLVQRYEESWVQMALALATGEKVHIVVFDHHHRQHVSDRLEERGCLLSQVRFFEFPTEDVWIRDNGPVFVFDTSQRLRITDWGFNGWGKKYDFELMNAVPHKVATSLGLFCTRVSMINEGGSIEVDGRGTLMAKKSSILNRNRNPSWKQADAETYFRQYLGVTNFIWLEGAKGQDVTDDHIDGTARFAQDNVIVTFYREDFLDRREYDQLKAATDANGEPYRLVHLPVTKRKVAKGDYGFYINFYVGNEVVLIPAFDDPSDEKAANILQALYSDRKVVSIPMREVYKDGGMVHCVTQQQPKA